MRYLVTVITLLLVSSVICVGEQRLIAPRIVEGTLVEGTPDQWCVHAQAGQTVSANVQTLDADQPNAVLRIFGPQGNLLSLPEGEISWSGRVKVEGDYKMIVTCRTGKCSYRLSVLLED